MTFAEGSDSTAPDRVKVPLNKVVTLRTLLLEMLDDHGYVRWLGPVCQDPESVLDLAISFIDALQNEMLEKESDTVEFPLKGLE